MKFLWQKCQQINCIWPSQCVMEWAEQFQSSSSRVKMLEIYINFLIIIIIHERVLIYNNLNMSPCDSLSLCSFRFLPLHGCVVARRNVCMLLFFGMCCVSCHGFIIECLLKAFFYSRKLVTVCYIIWHIFNFILPKVEKL